MSKRNFLGYISKETQGESLSKELQRADIKNRIFSSADGRT